MSIIKTVNPIDDSEMYIASGVVEALKVTKLDTPDKFQNTHKASLKIGDDWVNVSAFKSNRDNLTYQEKDKTWVEVTKGCEVKFVVKATEYKGKTYYEVKKSGLKVTKKATENASGEATSNSKPQSNTTTQGSSKEAQTGSNSAKTTNGSSGSAKTFKVYGTIKSIEEGVAVVVGEDSKEVQVILGEHSSEVSVGGRLTAQVDGEGNIKSGFKSYGAVKTDKENIGMLRCHAFNGATTLLNSEGIQINPLSILEAGKVIHDTTTKMKAWFVETEAGKAMDARELGNTVGNAVLNCASFSSRGCLEQDVKDFLTEIVPLMTDYITKPAEDKSMEISVPSVLNDFTDINTPYFQEEGDEDLDIPF